MIVIDFNKVEHDVIQKSVPTFWHHALVLPAIACCSETHAVAWDAVGVRVNKSTAQTVSHPAGVFASCTLIAFQHLQKREIACLARLKQRVHLRVQI